MPDTYLGLKKLPNEEQKSLPSVYIPSSAIPGSSQLTTGKSGCIGKVGSGITLSSFMAVKGVTTQEQEHRCETTVEVLSTLRLKSQHKD